MRSATTIAAVQQCSCTQSSAQHRADTRQPHVPGLAASAATSAATWRSLGVGSSCLVDASVRSAPMRSIAAAVGLGVSTVRSGSLPSITLPQAPEGSSNASVQRGWLQAEASMRHAVPWRAVPKRRTAAHPAQCLSVCQWGGPGRRLHPSCAAACDPRPVGTGRSSRSPVAIPLLPAEQLTAARAARRNTACKHAASCLAAAVALPATGTTKRQPLNCLPGGGCRAV